MILVLDKELEFDTIPGRSSRDAACYFLTHRCMSGYMAEKRARRRQICLSLPEDLIDDYRRKSKETGISISKGTKMTKSHFNKKRDAAT